ncbi:MAG: hypothetical protein M3441_23880 [Chloroflexota bacterium]|nr:hypothetical protein [Chloroflexota bacterium]
MLDRVANACHHMSFLVPPGSEVTRLVAPLMGRDTHLPAARNHQVNHGVASIPAIRTHPRTRQARHQRRRMRTSMGVPSPQVPAPWVPQTSTKDVDLCPDATAAPAQCLLILRAVVFNTSGTGMGTDHRTVQDPRFHGGVIGTVREHALPHALLTPTGKACVDAMPVAVVGGQQAPLRSSAVNPAHGFQDAAAGCLRSNVGMRVAPQQRPQVRPVVVRHMSRWHTSTVPALRQLSTDPRTTAALTLDNMPDVFCSDTASLASGAADATATTPACAADSADVPTATARGTVALLAQ